MIVKIHGKLYRVNRNPNTSGKGSVDAILWFALAGILVVTGVVIVQISPPQNQLYNYGDSQDLSYGEPSRYATPMRASY